MNFQCLTKIENSKFYINLAFSHAKERANAAREGIKGQRSVVEKSKTVELAKLEAVKNSLTKIMGNFPSIKENIFTVAIAGFPNVGKSTLLNKLTGAHAEIANYAFTTRSLNLGYMFEDGKRIVQVIDTPGTLNRHEKMNYIEIQAELAMQLC